MLCYCILKVRANDIVSEELGQRLYPESLADDVVSAKHAVSQELGKRM